MKRYIKSNDSISNTYPTVPVKYPMIFRGRYMMCRGYANDGTEITSSCWDWCCEDIVIHNIMDAYGLDEDSAVSAFWSQVREYDPEEYDMCVASYDGDPVACLNSASGASEGLDNLRINYLLSLGFDENTSELDFDIIDEE